MDSSTVGMIVALVICICLSAFFSASETAFSALNKIRMKSRADAGDSKAALTLAMAERYDELLSTILIGNNIVNIAASSLGTVLFIDLCGEYGPTVSTVVMTVVILIFGEISPKSIAKESPDRFALAVAPVLRLVRTVFSPLNFLFMQWKKLLARVFSSGENEGVTEEELITYVSEVENEGGLEKDEGQLIRNAIEFNDLEVSEILVPRVDICAVEDTATDEEIAAAFAESGYSRLPVYHDSLDTIVGVIHEKDFYNARFHGDSGVSAIMKNPTYTTYSVKISDLLHTLQRDKTHMAIVVDEYGGTEGLVTLEDILEELVGEIWDEHDEVVEQFSRQPDGSVLVAGSTSINDFEDVFSIKDDTDCSTVSGWVFNKCGKIPVEGETFEADGLTVTVTKVEKNRLLEIRVVEPEKPDEEEKVEK